MTIIQYFRGEVTRWAYFTTSYLIQISIMVVLILVKSCETKLALISVIVSEFASATTSAGNYFFFGKLNRLDMILITNNWRFPVIFLRPLILLSITYGVLKGIITSSTRLPLLASLLAD